MSGWSTLRMPMFALSWYLPASPLRCRAEHPHEADGRWQPPVELTVAPLGLSGKAESCAARSYVSAPFLIESKMPSIVSSMGSTKQALNCPRGLPHSSVGEFGRNSNLPSSQIVFRSFSIPRKIHKLVCRRYRFGYCLNIFGVFKKFTSFVLREVSFLRTLMVFSDKFMARPP